jgi:hypothetical protein
MVVLGNKAVLALIQVTRKCWVAQPPLRANSMSAMTAVMEQVAKHPHYLATDLPSSVWHWEEVRRRPIDGTSPTPPAAIWRLC